MKTQLGDKKYTFEELSEKCPKQKEDILDHKAYFEKSVSLSYLSKYTSAAIRNQQRPLVAKFGFGYAGFLEKEFMAEYTKLNKSTKEIWESSDEDRVKNQSVKKGASQKKKMNEIEKPKDSKELSRNDNVDNQPEGDKLEEGKIEESQPQDQIDKQKSRKVKSKKKTKNIEVKSRTQPSKKVAPKRKRCIKKEQLENYKKRDMRQAAKDSVKKIADIMKNSKRTKKLSKSTKKVETKPKSSQKTVKKPLIPEAQPPANSCNSSFPNTSEDILMRDLISPTQNN